MSKISSLHGCELLKKLSLAFGPSGYEDDVADIIKENIARHADAVEYCKDGSVIAVIRASKDAEKQNSENNNGASGHAPSIKRLMLAAHMDEVGFMVKSSDPNGFLKISPLSVNDPKVLAGRFVRIRNGDSFADGYIGIKPVHLTSNPDFVPDYESLYVDIGAESRAEAERYAPPGSFGTFISDFVRFGQNGRMIKGKAIDDRLGCTVICDLFRRIKSDNVALPFDLYAAFTCREELGISGAATAARRIVPDHAIVFESTAVGDIYGAPPEAYAARQGHGGVISLIDKSTIYNSELTSFIIETAEKYKIPCQLKKLVSGGNDAGTISRTCGGVKCAAISAPARYIHTSSNVIRESDFTDIENLAFAIIKRLSN